MKHLLAIPAAAAFLVAAGTPLLADSTPQTPGAPVSQCFPVDDFNGWRAPDNKTIFIRVMNDRFYRLDLAGTCPELLYPDSHLITHTRGPDIVCSAVDWDLRVSLGGTRSSAPCIVKAMTPLSAADVAAIPKGFKP